MPQEEIDWRRVHKAILQSAIRRGLEKRTDFVLEVLPKLVGICGEFSATRKMAYRIGERLLEETVFVIVPSCPDYGHKNGRYTFQGLNGGVSLVAELHLAFLQKVVALLPQIRPVILFADHEADDPELCTRVGKTREEFLALVRSSVAATKLIVPLGWQVRMMTEEIPDLVKEECQTAARIAGEVGYRARITSDTVARTEMYQRINGRLSFEEMRKRTILTAAQYVAMGNYATAHGYLICNHTTVNLASWYLQTEAAVLHNPVSVY